VTRILSLKIIQGKKSPNDKLVLINDHAVTSMEIALTLAHFCNNDEMNNWKNWLKEKNISIDDERGDKSSAGIYFHDPDGYTIEIYFVKES